MKSEPCRCGRPMDDEAHTLDPSAGHVYACRNCYSTHQRRQADGTLTCEGCGRRVMETSKG